MKKRYVLKNRKRFSMFLILLLFTVFTAIYANAVYGYRQPSYRNVFVKKGDTLWDIAEKNMKSGDIRKYIHDIKKINKLSSSEIFEGNTLKIPD